MDEDCLKNTISKSRSAYQVEILLLAGKATEWQLLLLVLTTVKMARSNNSSAVTAGLIMSTSWAD